MKPVPRTVNTNKEASVNPWVTREDSKRGTSFQNCQTGNDPTTGLGFYLCSGTRSWPALEESLVLSALGLILVMMMMMVVMVVMRS